MRSGLAWAAVMVLLATGCSGGIAASPPSPTTATRFTNTGTRCLGSGYPVLRFDDDAGRSIPFRVSRTGDQMVTGHSPLPVLIGHDRSAWVVLDKYRCDLAARAAVGHIEFRLGAEGRLGAVAPDSAGWAYCGPGGPGSIVHVSPFEPRRLAALRQG